MVTLGLGLGLGRRARKNLKPFVPIDLGTDLMAWYDATDAATITHASNVVSQWNDKSGNARHISQTGATTLRPTYVPASNKIAFDGGDYLFNATPFMYANGGVAIYAVISAPNAQGTAMIAEGQNVNATPLYVPIWTKQATASPDLAAFVRNDAGVTIVAGVNGMGGVFSDNTKKLIRIVDSGASFTGFANGVQASNVIAYTRVNPTTFDRFALGGLLRNTFASGWTGDIHEVVITKNDNFGLEMEGYLADKHGL